MPTEEPYLSKERVESDRNLQKHGVSFEEAQTIFLAPNSQTYNDPIHSLEEPRYIDIGMSARGRLLVVVYTERHNKIRIINVSSG